MENVNDETVVCLDTLYGEALEKAHTDFMYAEAGSVEQQRACQNITGLIDSQLKMMEFERKCEQDEKEAEKAEKEAKHTKIMDYVKTGLDVLGKVTGVAAVLAATGAAIQYDKTEVARNPVVKAGMNVMQKLIERKALKG